MILLVTITAFLLFLVCAYLRINSPNDVIAYLGMSGECHPVWKDLALRRIEKGDPIETLTRHHPPVRRDDFGRYSVLSYSPSMSFTGLAVVGKDGKLVLARSGSCTWQFTFFGSPEEEQVIDKAYAAYLRGLHEDR